MEGKRQQDRWKRDRISLNKGSKTSRGVAIGWAKSGFASESARNQGEHAAAWNYKRLAPSTSYDPRRNREAIGGKRSVKRLLGNQLAELATEIGERSHGPFRERRMDHRGGRMERKMKREEKREKKGREIDGARGWASKKCYLNLTSYLKC